jgi:hypothetical protein
MNIIEWDGKMNHFHPNSLESVDPDDTVNDIMTGLYTDLLNNMVDIKRMVSDDSEYLLSSGNILQTPSVIQAKKDLRQIRSIIISAFQACADVLKEYDPRASRYIKTIRDDYHLRHLSDGTCRAAREVVVSKKDGTFIPATTVDGDNGGVEGGDNTSAPQ